MNLSDLQIPDVSVVPEPTNEESSSVFERAKPPVMYCWEKVVWSLARRCQQLEADLSNCTCGSVEPLLAKAEKRIVELEDELNNDIAVIRHTADCAIAATDGLLSAARRRITELEAEIERLRRGRIKIEGQRDELLIACEICRCKCDDSEPIAQLIDRLITEERASVACNPSTVAQEIAARVWCDQAMGNCVMDVEAAKAIARIIDNVRRNQAEQ